MTIRQPLTTTQILADLAELGPVDLDKVIAVAGRHRERWHSKHEKNILFRLGCAKTQGRPTVALLSWDWLSETIRRDPIALTYVDEGERWYATGQLFVKRGDVIEQFPVSGQAGYAVIAADRQVVRVANLTAIGKYLRCELDLDELLARKDGSR